MIFVLITKECEEEAGRHQMLDEVRAFAQQTEKKQSLSSFDAFPPPYVVKKKFHGRQGRLIGMKKEVAVGGENHLVVALLSLMIRGDNDYDSPQGFGHDPEGYGNRRLKPIFEKQDFEGFVENRTRIDPPPPRPALGADAETYLSSTAAVTAAGTGDIIICESKNWIEKITDDGRREMLPRIREALADIVELGGAEATVQKFPVDQYEGWSVCYQWVSSKQLYVCDLQEGNHRIKGVIEVEKLSEVQRHIYRAYPDYMLLDEQLWVALAKDKFGNFSLSKEEMDILRPMHDKGLEFPLFINGRAGSGKSTILQYIYAEYFARYVKHDVHTGRPPAYFACNAELVRTATQLVKSILSNNPAYCEDKRIKDEVQNPRKLEGSFFVYREFLLKLVPSKTRNLRFAPDKYIDYARFNKLWEGKFGKTQNARRDYGPDISWHVIRTYIKGMSMDAILEKSDYAVLPKDQRSVSQNVFDKVYDAVWLNWYKDLTTKGTGTPECWDDQDLARYVIDREEISQKQFLGVFCDESQDFTRIELETFLRMSIYSNSLVYPHDLPRIPFVFAGDEFQTLNPTGFRWESVKSAFTEKFILGLCPYARDSTSNFHLEDLKNNYRSMPNIVRFGNSVQMLRGAKFGITSLSPQQEWKTDENKPITFFDENDEAFWSAIKAREDVHLIVPCHANEELDFVRNDPILSRHVVIDEKQHTTKPTVRSAVQAKGLEYPCVVAYGFGSVLEKDSGILDFDDVPIETEDRARFLSLEYFLNRLYVAVSRPQEQLYIVDSKRGVDALWRFAQCEDSLAAVRKHIRRGHDWENHVEAWIPGNANHLQADYTVNYEDMAQQYERTGIADRDPVSMSYAGNYYRLCKDGQDKANECYALAKLYAKDYEGAASSFELVKKYGRAGECYWQMANTKGWKAMERISAIDPTLQTRMEYRAARAVTTMADNLVAGMLGALASEVDKYVSGEWRAVVKALVDAFLASSQAQTKPELYEAVTTLVGQGLYAGGEHLAQKAFDAGSYSFARSLLESSESTKCRLYQNVMFKTEPYPVQLRYYQPTERDMDDEVCRLYEQHPDIEPSDDVERMAIFLAHWRKGNHDIAAKYQIKDEKCLYTIADNVGSDEDAAHFRRNADAIHMCGQTQNVALANIAHKFGKSDAEDWAVLQLLSLAIRLATGKQQPSGQDIGTIRNHVNSLARKWIKETPEGREKLIDIRLFAPVVERYAQLDTAVEFMRCAGAQSSDTIYYDRYFELARMQSSQKHGDALKQLRNQMKSVAEKAGYSLSQHRFRALPEMDFEQLLGIVIGAAKSEGKEASNVLSISDQTTEVASSPNGEKKSEVELQPHSDPCPVIMPDVKTSKAAESILEKRPESAIEGSEPSVGAESLQAAREQRDNGVELIKIDTFEFAYFSKKGRLSIRDQDDGEEWHINDKGISGDDGVSGYVTEYSIRNSSLVLTCTPTGVTIKDKKCGYSFVIRF